MKCLARFNLQLGFNGLPCGSAGKESACNAGDLCSIPGLGRSPGEGKGYPLQYSGLENSLNCIVHRVSKSWGQLSNSHFTSLHWGSIRDPIMPQNSGPSCHFKDPDTQDSQMPWGQMHLLYSNSTCPNSPECPTPTAFPSTPLFIWPLSGGSLQGPVTADTPLTGCPGLI